MGKSLNNHPHDNKSTSTTTSQYSPDSKMHQSYIKYFIPDWDDLVDPNYDFKTDTHSGGKGSWENQVYAHQIYDTPNYDGLLVSKVVAEKTKTKKKRINEIGVHQYLRVPKEFEVMGDCGAFDYINDEVPPFSTDEMLEYYTRLGFDYGVSLDHLIVPQMEEVKEFRYGLTIQNAEDFIKGHAQMGLPWTPIGAVQGWDPESYAQAAEQYVKMGSTILPLVALYAPRHPK
jgi:hypothetical protein